MILPIGNSSSIRRLPYITIILILLNMAIYFYSAGIIQKNDEIVYDKYLKYFNLVATNMKLKGMDVSDEALVKNEFNNPSVSEADSLYRDITLSKAEFEFSRENHLFNKFGVSRKNLSFMTLITSMFIHADIFHLAGNLWFLFLLGFNIEDIYGRLNYLIFYILSGIVSSFLFVMSSPAGSALSLVGASGAISGVMGAFMVKLFTAKIRFFYFIFPAKHLFGIFSLYAGVCLPFWFIQQIFESTADSSSNVAFIAHIGGFVFGAIIAILLSATKIEERFITPKVDEASNLLGLNREEENGISAYAEGDYKSAAKLLEGNFIKKSSFPAFNPLFVSLVKTGEERKAGKILDIFAEKLYSKSDFEKMTEAYGDIKENGLFHLASFHTKMNFVKMFLQNKNYEDSREILSDIAYKEKCSIMGYKALIFAYEQNILFDKINELSSDYVKTCDDTFAEMKKTLQRRINE